jgi:hypothetical protein
MSLVTFVPRSGYAGEHGVVNAGGGVAYDIGEALAAGDGTITVDNIASGIIYGILNSYPGLEISGTTESTPTASQDVIGPVTAHSLRSGAAASEVGDILTKGSDGLYVPTPNTGAYTLPNYLTYLPLPTGVAATDTANLNTALAQGGRIRPNPLALAGSYNLTAPLLLASGGNTDVDFGVCSFILTGAFNFLQNSAVAPTFTATDATTTVNSSVVVSPTLAAHAVAGMQIAVVGAGYTGGDGGGPTWLYGTVESVAGNNITVGGNVNGVAATFAVSGATAYLWTTRDKNVVVTGGIWNAASIWTANATRYAAANNSSFLRFRRCDGLTVKNVYFTQQTFTGGLGWCFGIDPADCTDVNIDDIEGQNVSTCVNATGPLARVAVSNIRGQTQDDQVAFGCTGATGCDTEGDIVDLMIDGVMANGSLCAVDLYSGQGNHSAIRYLDASVRRVKGTTQLHSVRVQDYVGVGQINARVEDVTARAGAGYRGIWNNTSTGKVATVSPGAFEPSDIGLALASCDPLDCAGSSAAQTDSTGYPAPGGFVILTMIKVPYQVPVANLWLAIQVAGSGLTTGKNFAGIYDGRTYQLIAETVDQTTNWESVGGKSMALTVQAEQSLTLPGGPGRFVWAAFLCNGTTPPIFVAKMPLTAAHLGGSLTDANRAAYYNSSGLTALPATLVPATIIADADLVFAGLN